MSREKRPAADTFGTSQLVKRAKSDANLGGSTAVALSSSTGQNGALIQAVRLHGESVQREWVLEAQCADRHTRDHAVRCSRPSWSSVVILAKSLLHGSIRQDSTLPLAQWIDLYVSPPSAPSSDARSHEQYSGRARAPARTTVCSQDISKRFWIYTGRATPKFSSLLLQTCTSRAGTWRLASAYVDTQDMKK